MFLAFLYPAGAATGYCFLLVTLPAQPQGTVSYSFLLSFFLSLSCRRSRKILFLTRFCFFLATRLFSHTSRYLILTKLGHSDRYLNHYSRTNNDGVRRHDGVTGVKKVIFTKKASSPTECVALTRDLCICITLIPSTKVITLKISSGVTWGSQGSKESFSPKRHHVLQNGCALMRDSYICISLTPSTKVITLKIVRGHLGSQGSKVHFH